MVVGSRLPRGDAPLTSLEAVIGAFHDLWGDVARGTYPKAKFSRVLEGLQLLEFARCPLLCPGCGRNILRDGELLPRRGNGETVKRCPCGRLRVGDGSAARWEHA